PSTTPFRSREHGYAGRRRVDASQPAAGDRAAHERDVQRGGEIVDKPPLPAQKPRVLDPLQAPAYRTLCHVAKVSVIDAHWMAVARGDEPADLVLSGGHVLSVFTKEWLDVDVAVQHGHVVGLGKYDGRQKLDVAGAYLVPGFVDAHMHIESSKLMVDEFARAVLAHGTTAVVADPHEIANVLGTDGIHWLLDCCEDIPLAALVRASPCVTASHVDSYLRPFTTWDIESWLRLSRPIGSAETRTFPGVSHDIAPEPAKL